ncbi:MAG TPA: hypothetical protein VM425_17995 [Myxococcota bacterium]|nr:hypothetical protein [Myxococcota bacterium]
MSIRLGDLLLRNKLINEHQLKEGLHAQTIFGGKLGTNLVELGYVNEHDLAKLLSAQLGIPCIAAGDLDNIDKDVLNLVPVKLVQKHMVLPLEVEGRTLRLAMSDPTHFPSIDEICFATGLTVDPRVAPEILLVYAIEKYYDVPRNVRFVRMAGLSQNLAETATASASVVPKLDGASADLLAGEEKEFGSATSNEEMALDGFPIHQVVTQLARAGQVSDILEVIREFVSEDFEFAAAFLFNGEIAVGGTHVGGKLAIDEFQELSFPVNSSELLFKVWNSMETFHGQPSISGVDHWYFSELGFPEDRPILCIPVISNDKIRCIILASENKKGELLDMLDMYSLLVKKLSLAFELLVLKNQILDLSEVET